jgi:signal transduction histidine kinase
MLQKDFFTSGLKFDSAERELRNKFQMMNIGILLSSVAVIYGSILNVFKGAYGLAFFEFILLCINVVLYCILRKSKERYGLVSMIVTAQFTLLLIVLIYVSSPQDMKHTWFFTYPIIILFFKNEKNTIPWFIFLISMILIAPFQPFFHTQYTFFQLFYLSFVLSIVSVIVYFYKVKIDEARYLIGRQERLLIKKVEELTKKDKLLSIQSKQAVMGEMISMIAHQWRQPLSTVTLNISNLQVKRLLGEKMNEEEIYKALETISDTIVYLSDTIDDFQTYFRPNKEASAVDINALVQKSLGFVHPRLKKTDISLCFATKEKIMVNTYANELIQVLLNIINNAVDEFISREVKVPQLIIDIKDKEENIYISISDNAGGISSENIDTIFEPYFSTKGKNGTGLGLYMSQMIMQKQFQTAIEVQSDKDGATFTIIVPKKLA